MKTTETKTVSHTPGPWHVTERDDLNVVSVFGPEGTRRDGSVLWPICSTSVNEPKFGDENRANARLIAAAPELLQALQLFVSLLQTDYGKIGEERACNGDYLAKVDRARAGEMARAAIAKATT